jgi:hypothetical protein
MVDGDNLLLNLPPDGRTRRDCWRAPPLSTRWRQPVRDAILAFLVEPRSAKDLADHIDRKVSVATGHLRAMGLRILVVRVSWSVWVRCDRCPLAPDPATIRRNNPAQDALLEHLAQPRTVEDLERLTGKSRSKIRDLLTKMLASGSIERQPGDKFAAPYK